jgi:hypothetical protein
MSLVQFLRHPLEGSRVSAASEGLNVRNSFKSIDHGDVLPGFRRSSHKEMHRAGTLNGIKKALCIVYEG